MLYGSTAELFKVEDMGSRERFFQTLRSSINQMDGLSHHSCSKKRVPLTDDADADGSHGEEL